MNKKYYVYKGSELMFSGDRVAVCNELNIGTNGFYEYTSGRRGLVHGIYKILKEKLPEAEKEIDLSDPFEYLKHHLERYGNTSCMFDPVPYLPDLYDCGLNCRVREVYDIKKRDGLRTPKARQRKGKPHYIVEVAV